MVIGIVIENFRMCISTEKKTTHFVEGGDAGRDREGRITRFIRQMNYGVHGMFVI